MPKIRRPYDPVCPVAHEVGAVCEQRYRLKRDDHGNCSYLPTEQYNVSEYVGSFEAGASLSSLLQRCNLMPLRDKIAYLQQLDAGQSVDLSAISTDLTAAFIQANKLAINNPDLAKRIQAGESMESIIKSIIEPKAELKAELKAEPTKEDNSNG